jgi:AdoMet-dependent rRNA methyltransferase SPB1
VEANKPEASRDVSAEIFLVCLDYQSPEKIDKKFFDPNFVFNENEKDIQDQKDSQNIQSISKLFQKKKKELIDEKGPSTMFRKASLLDFINSGNPYLFIQQHNSLDCSD